jgi:hypothetical protein
MVRVVHNTYGVRPDFAGVAVNTPAVGSAFKRGRFILDGTPLVEVVPELGPETADIVSHRIHGFTPFTGTSLDSILRNLGVRTVIPIGVVSTNVSSGPASAQRIWAIASSCRPTPSSPSRTRMPSRYCGTRSRWLQTLTAVNEIIDVWKS